MSAQIAAAASDAANIPAAKSRRERDSLSPLQAAAEPSKKQNEPKGRLKKRPKPQSFVLGDSESHHSANDSVELVDGPEYSQIGSYQENRDFVYDLSVPSQRLEEQEEHVVVEEEGEYQGEVEKGPLVEVAPQYEENLEEESQPTPTTQGRGEVVVVKQQFKEPLPPRGKATKRAKTEREPEAPRPQQPTPSEDIGMFIFHANTVCLFVFLDILAYVFVGGSYAEALGTPQVMASFDSSGADGVRDVVPPRNRRKLQDPTQWRFGTINGHRVRYSNPLNPKRIFTGFSFIVTGCKVYNEKDAPSQHVKYFVKVGADDRKVQLRYGKSNNKPRFVSCCFCFSLTL